MTKITFSVKPNLNTVVNIYILDQEMALSNMDLFVANDVMK